ncbi:MAG: 23S rRNA (adenine(2503)-C(2))-methyltransferase RlmN [Robiginitomaculum sp.]|nr:MAG: 23S rRNA (adenine(2503)-C(2))-methyltransferase RlmN [Robiginitomaculum sp.]
MTETILKPSLAGMDRDDLRAIVLAAGVPEKQARMRVGQLWRWIYYSGVTDFDAMTDIAKPLRAALAEGHTLERPKLSERQVSKDGTRKYLIKLGPGIEVEAVYIPGVGRSGALCVSSQVGCTLNCTFCHTGTQALVRNLTTSEIVTQIMIARDDLDDWPKAPKDMESRAITNIVFMGMGEPLYNLGNVAAAMAILSDGEGIAISRRRITVSTSGVVPKMHDLGEKTQAMLAISLHAVTDELRDELVPVNKAYPLKDLLNACRTYPGASNARRITFEYVMLKGVNDSDDEARKLVQLLRGIPAKINLIPFNPWPGSPYECSDWGRIEEFAQIVNKAGYASPIRTPRGRDIDAACGQLRSESIKKRASERMKERLAAQEVS